MQPIILLGYGAMAFAIAERLASKYPLVVCGRDFSKAQEFTKAIKDKYPNSTIESTRLQDDKCVDVTGLLLLLCVKPYALGSFEFSGRARAVFSILNAVSLEQLGSSILADSYIRAMPNICAQIGQSITALTGILSNDDQEIKGLVENVFNSIGKTIWVEEKQFATTAALGGCAPAFLALVAEALIDSGVKEGLTRYQSKEIITALFQGFSGMLEITTPTDIKERVMSPAGSTAQGVASLEKNAIRSAFFEAVNASKSFA